MPARRLLLALLTAATAAAPAHAATVTSGPLRADLAEAPWRLSFTGPGGLRLSESAKTGNGATGTLGFRAQARWFHATRVLKATSLPGGGLEATAATTDPGGRRLLVRLAPGGDGAIALEMEILGERGDVEALGIGFEAAAGERYLGFGERPERVDHRGATVESFVADGPYQTEERPFLTGFVPPAGYRLRADATYFPIPWLLSTRGYGVLIENDETVYHRLGSDDPGAWSVEVVGGPEGTGTWPAPAVLKARVFAGPRPADVLRRMSAHLGRQPAPDAPWVLGPWFQPGGSTDEQVAQIEALRKADAPVSVAQTYLHYLPCADHLGAGVRDAEKARVARMHSLGVAITTYFNPMVCTNHPAYAEAAAGGAFTADRSGAPYTYRYSTDSQFLVAQVDFLGAPGRALYGRLLGEAVADGHDGWMEDFGEYTPLDSRSAGGADGTRVHNRYPVDYHCAAHDYVKRQPRPVVRFQRSGWTGAARCAQVVWNGDPTTDWGFDGLASAVKGALSLGLSGVSTWGSDIGGFFALGQRKLDPELLERWVQFGALSPVMRTQRNGIALPEKARPQIEEPGQLANWRRYTKLHTQLYPYLAAADAEYRRSGLPVMRHLALAFPDDARAGAREDQYLFGGDLLAAPVLEPGATERALYLPAGDWVDLWRSARYDEASGGLVLGRPSTLAGGRDVTLPAPREELPLLVRAGAVLPLLPADVDTLATGAPGGTVELRDRLRTLELLAFPQGRWSTRLADGELLRSHVGRHGWRLRFESAKTHSLSVQAALPRKPCRVTVGRTRLRGWTYRDGVLRARWRAKRASLIAHSRCAH